MSNNIKDENFVTILGWMVNKLHLKNNELLVYAIIYGFSQKPGQVFNGGLQYLADWTESTKQGVQNNLKSLLNKKLIGKKEYYVNNIKYCDYWTL